MQYNPRLQPEGLPPLRCRRIKLHQHSMVLFYTSNFSALAPNNKVITLIKLGYKKMVLAGTGRASA